MVFLLPCLCIQTDTSPRGIHPAWNQQVPTYPEMPGLSQTRHGTHRACLLTRWADREVGVTNTPTVSEVVPVSEDGSFCLFSQNLTGVRRLWLMLCLPPNAGVSPAGT